MMNLGVKCSYLLVLGIETIFIRQILWLIRDLSLALSLSLYHEVEVLSFLLLFFS